MPAIAGDEDGPAELKDYLSFLANNQAYRLLLIGEVVDQFGQWGNYIATLTLADRLGHGANSGSLVALVVVVRCLPSLFLFPIAGVVADRHNRVKVLVGTNIVSAVVVCGLTVVRSEGTLWLMFALLTALFSIAAFFEPARRALTQQLVPEHHLPLAATLDATVWSVMAAAGASLGGLLVSNLGTTACFLLDGATYLVAAGLYALLLLRPMHTVYPSAGDLTGGALNEGAGGLNHKHRHDSASSSCSTEGLKGGDHFDGESRAGLSDGVPLSDRISAHFSSDRHSCDGGDAELGLSDTRLRQPYQSGAHGSPSLDSTAGWFGTDMPAQGPPSGPASAGGAVQQGLADLREGWRYMCAPGNRDVAPLTLIKASGCLLWGSSDVLYVKFTELPQYQIKDSAFTMGILFAGMGIGAFLGPMIFNQFTPSRAPHLLRAVALASGSLAFGYGVMTAATNMVALFPSVIIRSLGSATMWIYSTLLLQFRVPNHIQGRIFALEMAFYVTAESISGVGGGLMFDRLHLTTLQVSGVMFVISMVSTAAWSVYAWQKWYANAPPLSAGCSAGKGAGGAVYELVPLDGRDDRGDYQGDHQGTGQGHEDGVVLGSWDPLAGVSGNSLGAPLQLQPSEAAIRHPPLPVRST